LKDEMDLSINYKLGRNNTINIRGQEELMKIKGETPVTLTNYEEWLVLYMDNELSAEQKITVEQFIVANPSVKEELALLQLTQLQPEEIIFADKTSLYRKEEKVRPMPVRWHRLRQAFGDRRWRLAAAAVLLLGVSITTAILVNKKSTPGNTEIVKGTTLEKKATVENPVVTPLKQNSPVNIEMANNNNGQTMPVVKNSDNSNALVKEKNNTQKKQLPTIVTPNIVKEEPVVAKTTKTNDLPVPLNNPNVIKNDGHNKAIAANNIPKEDKQTTALTNSNEKTQNPYSSNKL